MTELRGRKKQKPPPPSPPIPEPPPQQTGVAFTWRRIGLRLCFVLGAMAVVSFLSPNSEKTINFAPASEAADRRQDVPCSKAYQTEVSQYPGCRPFKCGRVVFDELLSREESDGLLDLAKRGLALGGGSGGASILDMHSGALSQAETFVNIYKLRSASDHFSSDDFTLYVRIKKKIHAMVAASFNLDPAKLFLTKPTFFSRLTSAPPKTPHDEYWHPHVDKETYESFHYTSLVYLTTYGVDFTGGRFIFDDPVNVSTVIEPRKGRVSVFTSGWENLHRVERVESGTRFAMTVSFTCDPRKAISDPVYNSFNAKK